MFFEKDDQPVIYDPIFDQIPNLKYFGKTRKLLKMQRVFVKQRTEVLGDSEHDKCIPNLDTIKQAGVPPMYQSQALSFWKDIRDRRIDALHTYLEKQRIREEKKSQGIAVDSESDEDNPFAIYKYKDEQKCYKNMDNDINLALDIAKSSISDSVSIEDLNKETMEDTIDMSKYIDPKPSTSKSSDPCINIPSNKERKPVVKVLKKKMRRPAKSSTAKKHKKKQKNIKEEPKKNSNDSNAEPSSSISSEIPENLPITIETEKVTDTEQVTSNSTDNVETIKESDKEIVTSEIKDNVDDNSTDNTANKKSKKLLKREAKMKEISERLKSVAEEYIKANKNQ